MQRSPTAWSKLAMVAKQWLASGSSTRNLRSRPKPAVIRRRLDPLRESRQRIGCEDRRLGSVAASLITERPRTALVVALDQPPAPSAKLRDLIDLISGAPRAAIFKGPSRLLTNGRNRRRLPDTDGIGRNQPTTCLPIRRYAIWSIP